jgi:hypothetical protein
MPISQIVTNSIANDAVVTVDIANGAVTSAKMASGAARANFGAGAVLQVVSATYGVQTEFSTASYVDTGLTATITPSSATSRILVLVSQSSIWRMSGSGYGELRLVRDATALGRFAGEFTVINGAAASATFLDSPSTTSATTYKTQIFVSAPSFQLQRNSGISSITLLEIAA